MLMCVSPTLGVRTTPSPLAWNPLKPGMAWHHIIPFAVLQAVWNRLVNQFINTQAPESRTAIRQYLLLCGAKDPGLEAQLDRMRALNQTQRRAVHRTLSPLDDGDVLKFQEYAVWPASNAVEGPKGENRTDDPGGAALDRFTCGLTPDESMRMHAIQLLFPQLKAFIASGENPGPAALRALATAASAARPSLQRAKPIGYRQDMWVPDGPGKWRKCR